MGSLLFFIRYYSAVHQVPHINDRLAGKARGKCVTHFGW